MIARKERKLNLKIGLTEVGEVQMYRTVTVCIQEIWNSSALSYNKYIFPSHSFYK